jgi:hypothetical protein
MRPLLFAFAGFGATLLLHAQTATLRLDSHPPEDAELLAEAVNLLEKANPVSTPAVWLPNGMKHQFRVPNPAPGDAGAG